MAEIEYEVFKASDGSWRVEGVQYCPDGEIHMATFWGADLDSENERRAREYADWMNSRD